MGSDTTRVIERVGVTDNRVPVTRRLCAIKGIVRWRTIGYDE